MMINLQLYITIPILKNGTEMDYVIVMAINLLLYIIMICTGIGMVKSIVMVANQLLYMIMVTMLGTETEKEIIRIRKNEYGGNQRK
jgi:hypothetical protein